MHALRFLMSASLLVLLGSTSGADPASAQDAAQKTFLMPADKAKATFEDERVRLFLAVVAKEFGGACVTPDPAKTEATSTQRGGGDMSSAFYEINIPCPGRNGLAAVRITAEFSAPLGRPLDLVLALSYRQ